MTAGLAGLLRAAVCNAVLPSLSTALGSAPHSNKFIHSLLYLKHLLLLEMGYKLGEKADEVEEDDDSAVEVGRVSPPPLPGLQSRLASLYLPNCPLEHRHDIGKADWRWT